MAINAQGRQAIIKSYSVTIPRVERSLPSNYLENVDIERKRMICQCQESAKSYHMISCKNRVSCIPYASIRRAWDCSCSGEVSWPTTINILKISYYNATNI